jgi:hypothetical protein
MINSTFLIPIKIKIILFSDSLRLKTFLKKNYQSFVSFYKNDLNSEDSSIKNITNKTFYFLLLIPELYKIPVKH